jgi:mRNA-degrading endonuclease YafQ of YafQ-DinJ toxin-antitoxin module
MTADKYHLVATTHFLKNARKFLNSHPDLRMKFERALDQLVRDPFDASLDSHPLRGPLKGMLAVKLTASYRITFTVFVSQSEIVHLDISSHDEVYR